MPVISTIFDGAAHVTVSGCLAAFLFKRTIVDRTSKAIKEAENTARILLRNDTEPNLAPLAINESNFSAALSISSIYSSTSTPTNSTAPCTPLLPSSPVQRPKRLSIDSDVTLVDNDDDFAGDPPGTSDLLSLGSTPSSIATPQLKPLDKKHQSSCPGEHKHESRASRLVAVRDSIERTHANQLDYISQLEQLQSELLVDQATLIDGWAAAMAQLGLTSMLSPGTPLPYQKTLALGNLTDILQD
ncbi:hypothetical protein DEU56DRAFT_918316 [Suillus clintonianus]|uniref:uncharacterized protein n=1 Tax=Suillus clintonianus TaxID=1904413 RepID=UPI001B87CCA4|nr:uncharacterized protein DEU56DRAFT_918316 [Suillus clintonianus]KAG2121240.1 hypothetical protein DEU56DRAFT_918316 [Suillus clintonianus]